MTLLLCLLLNYAAMAGAALSQPRHWQRLTAHQVLSAPGCCCLRLGGVLASALSLVLALVLEGVGFGSVLWLLSLSTAATAVAFTLAWMPGLLMPLAALAGRLPAAQSSASTAISAIEIKSQIPADC